MAAEIEAELATPAFPLSLSYVWEVWSRLRRRCRPGPDGPSPWTWIDLDAFIRRTGLRLTPYEIDLLERVDDAYLAHWAEQAKAKSQASRNQPQAEGAFKSLS